MCIALDLYIALCHPLRYDVIVTSRRANILLVVAWTCSGLCGMSISYVECKLCFCAGRISVRFK